jgi:hypothetical protein
MSNINVDALDSFLGDEKPKSAPKSNVDQSKKVIVDQREGLIERVDKVFITKDGKQLLREQY